MTLWVYIQDVLSSNLGHFTVCPNWFPSVRPGKCRHVISFWSWQFASAPCPIHHSSNPTSRHWKRQHKYTTGYDVRYFLSFCMILTGQTAIKLENIWFYGGFYTRKSHKGVFSFLRLCLSPLRQMWQTTSKHTLHCMFCKFRPLPSFPLGDLSLMLFCLLSGSSTLKC